MIHDFVSAFHCNYSSVLFCTIFGIFDVEDRDLEIQVRGHSSCKFIHDLCIAELYRPGVIFLLVIVRVCFHATTHK